jgi:hypothetical protein
MFATKLKQSLSRVTSFGVDVEVLVVGVAILGLAALLLGA